MLEKKAGIGKAALLKDEPRIREPIKCTPKRLRIESRHGGQKLIRELPTNNRTDLRDFLRRAEAIETGH